MDFCGDSFIGTLFLRKHLCILNSKFRESIVDSPHPNFSYKCILSKGVSNFCFSLRQVSREYGEFVSRIFLDDSR